MQPNALRALEFDRIVEAVSEFALTPMGAERLAALEPSTDAQKVAQLLAATTETMRFIAAHGLFPLRLERSASDSAGARRVSRFDGRIARRHPTGAGIVPNPRGREQRRRLVQGRSRTHPRKN